MVINAEERPLRRRRLRVYYCEGRLPAPQHRRRYFRHEHQRHAQDADQSMGLLGSGNTSYRNHHHAISVLHWQVAELFDRIEHAAL